MSGRAQKLLGEALDLTDEERAEVALELVASLDGPRDADAEDAWVAEIERRARRVLADPDGGEDWSAARAEIESKLPAAVKPVRVEPEAKQELAAAATWYEQQREGLGRELLAEVDAVFTAIARSPSRFPLYPRVASDLGVRRAAARRFPLLDRLHRAGDRRSRSRDRPRQERVGEWFLAKNRGFAGKRAGRRQRRGMAANRVGVAT